MTNLYDSKQHKFNCLPYVRRHHADERDDVEKHRRRIETQLNDMTQQLNSLGIDGSTGSLDNSFETVRN